MVSRQVWMTCNDYLSKVIDMLPSNIGRQTLVTSMIQAYGLDRKCHGIIDVSPASRKELESYHSSALVKGLMRSRETVEIDGDDEIRQILQHLNEEDELEEDEQEEDELEEDEGEDLSANNDLEVGLVDDCYPFPFMSSYVRFTAGSSLATAQRLVTEKTSKPVQNVAINWYGGRHHCRKGKAAGFCYVNDIILAIGVLRKSFGKVFYIDFDLHHGDGVEYGYEYSKNVLTCSVHRWDVGFYPGTGSLESSTKHKYNIPTRRGLTDDGMMTIVQRIILPLIENFQPGAILLQCGCDGLALDKHREWNMTINGFSKVIETVLGSVGQIPVMLVGGGGYNHTETAKCWTHITLTVLGTPIEFDMIPEHEHLDVYEKDGYAFWSHVNSKPLNMKDENDEEYIENIRRYLLEL
jgi:histone deacetylase HOS1